MGTLNAIRLWGKTIITYNVEGVEPYAYLCNAQIFGMNKYYFRQYALTFLKPQLFYAANILTVCRVVYEQHTINHFKLSIFQFRVFQLNNNAWNVAISQQHSLLGIIVIAVRNCSQQRVVLCCALWPKPKGIGIGDNFFQFNFSFSKI